MAKIKVSWKQSVEIVVPFFVKLEMMWPHKPEKGQWVLKRIASFLGPAHSYASSSDPPSPGQ